MQQHLNTVYLGDCTQIMQSISQNSIDLILTDPPYLVNYRDRRGRTIANDINHDWLEPAFQEMHRILRNNRFAISFYGWNHVDKFMSTWRKTGFRIVGHFVFAMPPARVLQNSDMNALIFWPKADHTHLQKYCPMLCHGANTQVINCIRPKSR